MTGKRLFFLSLIILSVAMGLHWIKHRPKTKPKRTQPRIGLRLDDLQLQDEPSDHEGDSKQPSQEDDVELDLDADPEFVDPDESDPETNANNTDEEDQETDSSTTDQPNTDTVASNTHGIDDPIITAFHNLPRNPFQKSPYATLMNEIKTQQKIAQIKDNEVTPSRQVKLLNANFSATIQTNRELVAVINSSLYRKGQNFQDKEITEIREEYVSLESPEELILIPKHGVDISIDDQGNYTVTDTFRQ